VQYDKQELMRHMRKRLEEALREGKVNMRESALLLRRYEEGLAAYTYLADDNVEPLNGDLVFDSSAAATAARTIVPAESQARDPTGPRA
jgi:hypothetical protein